ncbi:MAG: hypothetical protein QOJ47_1184, partial [Gaiellales bacterium]|nr:hypothetical protein [Gaiellales bacterium]
MDRRQRVETLAREPRVVGRRLGDELPREGDEGRLDGAGRPVGAVLQRVVEASREPHGTVPEDRVGKEAVRFLGAHERAQLVARRRRVEVPQRDRVPARVPQELRRELGRVGAVEGVLHALRCVPDHTIPREGDASGAFHGTSSHGRADYVPVAFRERANLGRVLVSRNDTVLECPLCGRTLLLGERAARYRVGTRQLLVCELCVDDADSRGWLREGAPVPPPITVPLARGSGRLSRLLGSRRSASEKEEAAAPEV